MIHETKTDWMIYVGDLNKLLLYTGIIIAYEKPIMYPPVPTRNCRDSAFWFSENNSGDLHPRFAPSGQLEVLLVSSCVGKLSSFHCSNIIWKSTKESGSFFLWKKVISQEAIVDDMTFIFIQGYAPDLYHVRSSGCNGCKIRAGGTCEKPDSLKTQLDRDH